VNKDATVYDTASTNTRRSVAVIYPSVQNDDVFVAQPFDRVGHDDIIRRIRRDSFCASLSFRDVLFRTQRAHLGISSKAKRHICRRRSSLRQNRGDTGVTKAFAEFRLWWLANIKHFLRYFQSIYFRLSLMFAYMLVTSRLLRSSKFETNYLDSLRYSSRRLERWWTVDLFSE